MQKIIAVVLGFSAFPAFAAIDLTPVTAAQTDMLTVAGAFLALSIAVWGAMKVIGMFGRK